MTYDDLMETLLQAEEEGLVTLVCQTHDVLPMDEGREQAWEDGIDACLPVIGFTKETLEEHHPWD